MKIKAISAILALVLCISPAVPAFAADELKNAGTVTIAIPGADGLTLTLINVYDTYVESEGFGSGGQENYYLFYFEPKGGIISVNKPFAFFDEEGQAYSVAAGEQISTNKFPNGHLYGHAYSDGTGTNETGAKVAVTLHFFTVTSPSDGLETDGIATREYPISNLATPTQTTTTTVSDEIKVLVNGIAVVFDQPPVIESGRTLVPLRAIFEALGATVDWNQATQTVTAVRDDVTITLQIGSDILYKNGEAFYTLDVPAKIVGGRTLVPARAVAESFGAKVDWEQATRTVTVTE